MKLWIARTPNNGLYIFINKPFWREDLKLWCEWRRWTTESDRLTANSVFVFPTEEMRDAFYENFKSDIEICKELL